MASKTSHDSGYKQLFSHPQMVRDLLLGFVPGPWLKNARFDTLERINASYVSESEQHRHNDMVWRLKVGTRWVWVYLLLEFQSKPDKWMAVRMMAYVSLLAQALIKQKQLQQGQLPALIPLVLYNDPRNAPGIEGDGLSSRVLFAEQRHFARHNRGVDFPHHQAQRPCQFNEDLPTHSDLQRLAVV